jgi:hypothetical protein
VIRKIDAHQPRTDKRLKCAFAYRVHERATAMAACELEDEVKSVQRCDIMLTLRDVRKSVDHSSLRNDKAGCAE